MTAKQTFSILTLSGLLIGFSPTFPSWAETSHTVIDGPGFKVENKKGWFGTSQQTYRDAFGNTYVKKKGLFGRTRTESNLMGSKVNQSGKNVAVTGPDGKPLITKKRTFWGHEETHVDGNNIWDSAKELFKP